MMDNVQDQINLSKDQQDMDIAASTSPEEQMMYERNQQDSGLTKWQQDLHPWLAEMVHELKREVMDDEERWVKIRHFVNGLEQDMPALCSEECIQNLVAKLKPNTSPNLINSKYDEEVISREMRLLENSVILNILIPERKKYKTPLRQLSQVKIIFRSYAKPTFYRAWGGFEAINQRQIRTVKELHTPEQRLQQKKKFSIFGG